LDGNTQAELPPSNSALPHDEIGTTLGSSFFVRSISHALSSSFHWIGLARSTLPIRWPLNSSSSLRVLETIATGEQEHGSRQQRKCFERLA